MLSAKEIVEGRSKSPPELPLFGEKSFEPDESLEQSCQIQHSISEIKNIISQERIKTLATLSQAIWLPELLLAEVTHQTGSYWTYMGHKIGQKLYIYPEEALYLLETGCMQILYNGVPLSVQRAYSLLLGAQNNITIEKYRVFSLLSGYGYRVLRHSPQNSLTKYEKNLEVHKLGIKLKNYSTSVKSEKRPQTFEDECLEVKKKLKVLATNIFPIVYNKDEDCKGILKRTQVVQPFKRSSETNLDFDYDIYSEILNKQSFKKSCLQLPNFRIVIHRGDDPIPDMKDLCNLSNKYKDEIPVIHAIVFFDCISFYKIESVVLPDISD